jgi:RNA polymerase sigma-70 factor (ECF subfamily)
MPADINPDTEQLIERAFRGDDDARQRLLERHRARLRQIIAVRLDRRLLARLDASDVVQDVLVAAASGLDEYLRHRPLPFFAWLRQFAWDRMIELHRRHVQTRGRSVAREEPWSLPLPDESVSHLARHLVASGTSPSRWVLREERRDRVRAALGMLSERDREVLVMRHLEQLENAEIAGILGIGEGAVRTRHVRALQRLRVVLEDEGSGSHR